MKNCDESVKINHNLDRSYIPDHPYRIFIFGGSGLAKTNVLLKLIKNQRPGIDKIYLCAKERFESKYQLLINRREKVGMKKIKKSKAFIDYSHAIDDAYENLEDYNPTKKRKVLIVFDDTIADIEFNKKVLLSLNCFQVEKNSIFHLLLYHNFISNCLKL